MRRFRTLMFAFAFFAAGQVMAIDVLDQLSKYNIPKPSVVLSKVSIKSISLQDLALRLNTEVDNPYPVSLPKAGLDLNLNIEGNRLLKLSKSQLTVPAKKTSAVPFDVGLKFKDLVAIYKKFASKEALAMALDGKIKLPLPIQKLKQKGLYFKGMPSELGFPIKAQRELPAIRPNIALRNFKIRQPSMDEIKAATTSTLTDVAVSFVNSLLTKGGKSPGSAAKNGLSGVDLPLETEFELVLTNEAASRVLFEALNYNLMLGKEKFLQGDSTKIDNKGRESIVTVKTSFPLKSVTAGIAEAIKQRKAVYTLGGTSGVSIPALPGDGKVPFNFDTSGQLQW